MLPEERGDRENVLTVWTQTFDAGGERLGDLSGKPQVNGGSRRHSIAAPLLESASLPQIMNNFLDE
jgi:hypothetical protein